MATEPTRKRLSREERRRQIILRSVEVFARRGFHAATTAEIAQECGVSEALLYQHFRSKKELFLASMVLTSETIIARMQDLLQSEAHADTEQKQSHRPLPKTMYSFMYNFLAEHPTLAKMSLMMLAEADDPDIRKAVAEMFQRVVEILADIYRDNQAKGLLRDDIDADALGWLNVGIYQLMSLLRLLGDDVKFDAMSLQSLTRIFALDE